MSLNLSFGGDRDPFHDDLDAALASRGLPRLPPPRGPLQVWSVKQAAPALIDAADAVHDLPVLQALSLAATAFVPLELEGFATDTGGWVASLDGLIADLERLGPQEDPIVEDARCRFLFAAREARAAGAVLWLG